jgi:hypothetical protein
MSNDERGALTAAIAALADMSMVLDGWQPDQIGIDPREPGAQYAADRLRRAAAILDQMRARDLATGWSSKPSWWSPN